MMEDGIGTAGKSETVKAMDLAEILVTRLAVEPRPADAAQPNEAAATQPEQAPETTGTTEEE
jgi:hypothetical protein